MTSELYLKYLIAAFKSVTPQGAVPLVLVPTSLIPLQPAYTYIRPASKYSFNPSNS